MISLANLSIRRPKSAIAAWLIIAVSLSLIGLGVSSTLSPSINTVPGTESARAEQLATSRFGPTQLVAILLEGPKSKLDREGPALVQALAKRADTRVLSPWNGGSAAASLRPKPTAAMILASLSATEQHAVKYDEPQIESLVGRKISAPVRSFVTGQPSIDRGEQDASLANLHRDALIALGIVFLLLLIGLGAPIAALVVTAVAALGTFAGWGVVALLGNALTLDPVGVAAGTMIGLALAVALGFLILDRFRHEAAAPGSHPRTAARAAIRGLETTGRAVLIGAAALVLALVLVSIVGPAELMMSVGTGVLTSVLFAIGGAIVVMPAALVLLGPRLSMFSFHAPAALERRWLRLTAGRDRTTRRAVYTGLAAAVTLGAIAIPAAALGTGPESVSQLPASSKARIAFDEVSRVMGPGWVTPYTITIASKSGPITTPALLAAIDRLEQKIANNKSVASVNGPGQIYSTSAQLQSFGPQLRHSAEVSDKSKSQLLQLINGLGQAGSGSKQLQAGLAAASSGSSQLHSGASQAGSGAGQLHSGLAQAQAGSAKLQAGLNSALTGATALEHGSAQALSGSSQLVAGLAQAQAAAKPSAPALDSLSAQTATTSSDVASALSELQSMTTGKNDPRYTATLNALTAANSAAATARSLAASVAAQAPALIAGLNQLHTGAAQLQTGLDQLHSGNTQLASGISQLSGGGGQLSTGLSQLTAGAGALQIGLGQLTNGAGQLADGLTSGVGPAGQLTAGLGTMQAAVTTARGQIPSTAQLRQLEAQSPGIFKSGYFVLSAIDGATPASRNAAAFTLNLDRGGTAGQITVFPKYGASDPRTMALDGQLTTLSNNFALRNHVLAAVGGPAGGLHDLTSVTESRIWLDVAAIAFAVMLVLALALRSVLLPAVVSLFGALVAGATFGVLALLFGGPHPPMGGPGYLDPITIISVFALAFGITAMFSIVPLRRARTAFATGAGTGEVLKVLREATATTTRAGLLMIGALIPFVLTGLLNVRALGIGLAVAVLLNALIVGPALLPAALALVRRYGWWPTVATGFGSPGHPHRGKPLLPQLPERRVRPARP